MPKKKDYTTWSKTELIREVDKLEKRKKYGLVWEKKPEEVAELCKEKLPILKEDTKKAINKDEKKPTNIIIEGDNYHALSVLNYTHRGKVDVIYIDPPYNRGTGDFKYNDKFVDREDGYRHSKWVSFMEKRLNLAKKLLKNDGVIFISIDENEFAQLKLLCDEIFGDNDFLGNLIWKRRGGIGSFAEKNLTQNHEYILVYRKRKGFLYHNILGEKRKKQFAYKDSRGVHRWIELVGPSQQTKERRPNLDYAILYDKKNKKIIGFLDRQDNKEIFDGNYSKNVISIWLEGKATWLVSKKVMGKHYKNGLIKVFEEKGKYKVRIKNYLYNEKNEINGMLLKSLLSDNDLKLGMNTEGTKQIKQILYPDDFSKMKPKPVSLISLLLHVKTNKNSVVLDFFAGTGTTGHAVMNLNEQDGGNRKFILCTNNEDNICVDVCHPRIRNLINGYDNPLGKFQGYNTNLKYFKTDFVNAELTDKNKKKLVDKSTDMLCLKEECFDKVKKSKHFQIFKDSNDKYLGIVFDDEGIDSLKKEIKKIGKKFIIYVFSLDGNAREEEFENILDQVDLRPIPEVILNVYKRIFK